MYLTKAWKYYKRHTFALIMHCLAGMALSLCYLLIPQITRLIVDCVLNPAAGYTTDTSNIFYFIVRDFGLEKGSYALLGALGGTLLLVGLTRHIIHYIRWNVMHSYEFDCEIDMRNAIFAKILKETQTELATYNTGELMTIANSDVVSIKDFFLVFAPWLAESIFAFLCAAAFLFNINPYLSIPPFAIGIFLIIIALRHNKKIRPVVQNIRDKTSELNMFVQENINGVRVVRAYARENYEMKRFHEYNQGFSDAHIKNAYKWLIFSQKNSLLITLIYLSTIGIGAYFTYIGEMTLGDFTAFGLYIAIIVNTFSAIPNNLSIMMQDDIAAKRVFNFLDTGLSILEPVEAKNIIGLPSIKVMNATVAIEGLIRLNDISIDIPFGKKVGVMGVTGCGKSVFIRSLSRFLNLDSGAITINGVNINDLSLSEVRGLFSYVIQEVFLFSNTVESNIAFGNPDVDFEHIIKASKIAEAHDFITKLTNGYDTVIGERGVGLSGGQKQRLSIARALLKNAPILVLDDATSALDTETEHEIFKNIIEKYPAKTLIITAHRATSVVACDEIIFMEHGKIVERGNFAELMALRGRYYEIYHSQKEDE